MQVPSFNKLSEDDKFCKVLLYYPLQPGAVIDVERLGKQILELISN